MKKIIGHIFTALLAIVLCLSIANRSFCALPPEGDSVNYYSICPDSNDGRHHFHGTGLGWLYQGYYPDTSNCIVSYGQACQCQYCYAVIVSQYNPYTSTALGKYGISNYPHTLSGHVCVWVSSYSYNSNLYADSITQAMVFE